MIPEIRNTPHQVSRQGWWGVLRSWLEARGLQARLGMTAVALAVLAAGIWFMASRPPHSAPVADNTADGGAAGDRIAKDGSSAGGNTGGIPSSESLVPRDIDGVLVPHGKEHPDLVAVAMDNMYEARPVAGLSRASVVIEAPVEGGITRFFAIYALDGEVPKIGPVRSARPYFVDWAQEYGAVFAHVGGSPDALDLLAAAPVRDANEYSAGNYFWRSADRSAPHNTYTSLEKIRLLNEKRFPAKIQGGLSPWKFTRAAAAPAETPDPDIVIPWSGATYEVTWKFDPQTRLYERFQGGKPVLDDDGSVVRAANVVVQYAKVRILDEVGRRRISTVGSGPALVATAGRTAEAVWEKKSLKDRIRFLVNDGEASLSPGATWIEAVPSGMVVRH